MSGVKEECGVFGIYDLDGGNIAPSIYYGLTSLQHRGQGVLRNGRFKDGRRKRKRTVP